MSTGNSQQMHLLWFLIVIDGIIIIIFRHSFLFSVHERDFWVILKMQSIDHMPL